MATIYSEAAASNNINNLYFDTDTATTAATRTTTSALDLSSFLSRPATAATYAQIEHTINQHITSGIASGMYPVYSRIADYSRSDAGNGWVTVEPNNNSYSGTVTVNSYDNKFNIRIPPSERYLKQQKIKNNLLIKVKSRGTAHKHIPENEQIAMDTLREYITETEFRKYLRFGFICIDGQEGRTYQIFKNHSHTKVWKDGKVIEEVCVYLKNKKIPPTDTVIAFRTMIKTSEEDFRKLGNVYNMRRAA